MDAFFVCHLRQAPVEGPALRAEVAFALEHDGAKGYLFGLTTGVALYNSDTLTVYAASTAQLLAMKLVAWRDAIDRGDAKLLLSQMSGSAGEIWSAVKPFVPLHQLDKASYAFEDLWETRHEPS